MKSSNHSIRHHVLVATLALVALPMALACATTGSGPALAARPSGNQQVVYEDGAEKIISMQPNSIVSLRIAEPSNGRSAFVVGVANQSQGTVVIAPEMVTVSQMGRSVQVFRYEEVAEQERKARDNEMITKALLGGVTTGLSSFAGVGASTAYLSGIQSGLQAASQGVSSSASKRDITLKELASTSLKKNTLFPSQQGGGVVYAKKLGAGPVQVRVQVGGESHEFTFSL